ncbi:hypothetical protein TRICI_001151 [Trichomonascus ciferrii]|uniref:RING-type domain-containing protein n=1 Tax=Trichomonascus ciferrii TaxID=44093 RepID=A0A642VA74_9ASCO|nr:hypothetical protein TRICI_001151 [Trichomonascus ciferrii]
MKEAVEKNNTNRPGYVGQDTGGKTQVAGESGGRETTSPKAGQTNVFKRCTFVIVTVVKMIGIVFAIIGLSFLFVSLGVVAAILILLCPWIAWPAFRSGWQQGYYVQPSPQQQELQQQIVETFDPQNTETLTEEQVNQKFPAITYKRAKALKDKTLNDASNQLEGASFDNDIVPFEPTERDDTCAVCLEDMADPDPVRLLACNHIFHAECIDIWITVRRSCCPLCKADQYHAQTNLPENKPSTFRDFWNSMPFPSALKIKRRRRNHRNPNAASRRRGHALRRILERTSRAQAQQS